MTDRGATDFLARRYPDPGQRIRALQRLLERECRDAQRQMGTVKQAFDTLCDRLEGVLLDAARTLDLCDRAEACYRQDGTVDLVAYEAWRRESGLDRAKPLPGQRESQPPA